MAELPYLIRIKYLRKFVILGLILSTINLSTVFAQQENKEVKITILHTNDVHSRVEPFPLDGSRYAGLGGAARRAHLISKIRSEEKNVLLFDAGDIFQGTPYFNLFDGEVELELMSKMGYDAATFGNHEFDNGIPGILKHFDKATFPFITSNYDFSRTALAGKTKEYEIFVIEGIRIGVFSLGVSLDGLVDPINYQDVGYLDPVEVANRLVPKLKNEEKCDFIICLSHLGYTFVEDKISDLTLVPQTKDIDLIIGGHTHTLLDKPTEVRNANGQITLVNQVGTGGVKLGRIDISFSPHTKQKRISYQSNYPINKKLEK